MKSFKNNRNHCKSMKIVGNEWNSLVIERKPWKNKENQCKIFENHCFSLFFNDFLMFFIASHRFWRGPRPRQNLWDAMKTLGNHWKNHEKQRFSKILHWFSLFFLGFRSMCNEFHSFPIIFIDLQWFLLFLNDFIYEFGDPDQHGRPRGRLEPAEQGIFIWTKKIFTKCN